MKKQLLFLILLFTSVIGFAQKTNPASGGSANGEGSVTYTVGQTIYTTNIGANGSVSQGIQQSLEVFVLSNPEVKELILNAVTYPNPTKDKLILELKDLNISNLTYYVYDIKGRQLLKGNIKDKNTTILMKNYTSGVYLLKVTQLNKELKTFKIIKK